VKNRIVGLISKNCRNIFRCLVERMKKMRYGCFLKFYKLQVRFYSAIINLIQTMKWFYQPVVAFNSVPLKIFVVDNYSIQL